MGSTSKQGDTAIAQPPELIQSIEQKLAKMDEIIPALQVAAAGLSNDAGARHDPASSLQRGNYDGQQQLAISMRPNQSSAMQDVPDPEGMPTQAAFQSQLDDLGSNLKRLLQKYFATTGANIGNRAADDRCAGQHHSPDAAVLEHNGASPARPCNVQDPPSCRPHLQL